MNKFKKYAFSLAEAIMSMILISIVSICLVPVLSKMRPGAGANPNTAMGAFICYYNTDGTLKRAYYDGRTEVTTYQDVDGDTCIFKENKRAGRLYYVAAGAGSNNVAGQVITGFAPEADGDLVIRPGKEGNSVEKGATTIENKGLAGDSIIAYPGFDNYATSGIMPNNIKRCKLVSGACPVPTISSNPASTEISECMEENRIPDGCEVIQYKDEENRIEFPAFQISGCGCTNELNRQHTEEYTMSDGTKIQKPLDIIPVMDIKKEGVRIITMSSEYKFLKVLHYTAGGFVFNVDLEDSSYDNELPDKSHMADILTNMNALRHNKTIDKLIYEIKPGKKGNKGAVVLLW